MNEGTAIKIMIETEEYLIGDFIEKLVEESKKQPIDYHRVSTLSTAITESVIKRKALLDVQTVSKCIDNMRTNN